MSYSECDRCGKKIQYGALCRDCDIYLTAYCKGERDGRKLGRADALEQVENEMYYQAFLKDHELDGLQKWDGGNWIRYKLFENVIGQLKEQK